MPLNQDLVVSACRLLSHPQSASGIAHRAPRASAWLELRIVALLFALVAVTWGPCPQQLTAADEPPAKGPSRLVIPPGLEVSSDWQPLNPQKTVWLDMNQKRVIVFGEIVLREGLLELLCCLKRTKEHEAIIAVDAQAQAIHAGLLAIGAEVGEPATFMPEYKPATGQRIDVFVTYLDENNRPKRVLAQEWVRNATRRYFLAKLDSPPADLKIPEDSDLRWDSKYKELLWYGHMTEAQRDQLLKYSQDPRYREAITRFFEQTQYRPLEAHWVFAGSSFTRDPESGKEYYLAESGDLICVSNFSTATLDLPVESPNVNDTLLYEAWTDRIPPLRTVVRMELVPSTESAKPVESRTAKPAATDK